MKKALASPLVTSKRLFTVSLVVSLAGFIGCISAADTSPKSLYESHKVSVAPVIDGIANEDDWDKGSWRAIDQVLIGKDLQPEDFSGRMKVLWGEERLYLLAEIVDDVMSDVYADPLSHYWDDECLEIFVDEDASGGNHQFTHNAFAYHVGLDNQVVDVGPAKTPLLYNHHVTSRWTRQQGKTVWEASIAVYSDNYVDGDATQQPVKLQEGKALGFMLAYCDNDGGKHREHFIGTENIVPVNGDRNLGWIDASVFGLLNLVR